MEHTRRLLGLTLGLLALAGAGAGAWSLLAGTGPARRGASPVLSRDRVVVEVLNGSGRRGLARVATRTLRAAGFDVVFFGTTSQTVHTTEAIARRGDSMAAARVARALGTTRARLGTDTLRRVDVTVLLGADYHPPPGIRP